MAVEGCFLVANRMAKCVQMSSKNEVVFSFCKSSKVDAVNKQLKTTFRAFDSERSIFFVLMILFCLLSMNSTLMG